jgi:CheY-like chemotaxis protein
MDRESRQILLVDGSPAMLYYHAVLLKRLEYAVTTASTPEDALAMMPPLAPSLIVTAFSFPRMSGIEFIKAIKGAGPSTGTPVIMITAEEDPAVRSACAVLGCTACLLKPAEPAILYRTIQTALEPTPRAHIRLQTSLKVLVENKHAANPDERTAFAMAISEGGLYLRTLAPQPKDASVHVRIFIKEREIKAKAVVLYTCKIDGGAFREPGMGMKFVEISEDDRAFVRGFIKDQLVSDIVPGV